MKVNFLILPIVILFSISSCKKKCKTDCEEETVFDRKEMVSHLTSSYIIPAYQNYLSAAEKLQVEIELLIQNPTVDQLNNSRLSWKELAIAWQKVSFLEFGPAENIGLRSQTNIYPADTSKINSNISSGTYNLSLPANYVAKGIQSTEYLLYLPSKSNQELVDYFNSNNQLGDYITAIVLELVNHANSIHNEWNTFKTEFMNNTSDNAQGSAVSDIVNALSAHFETFVRKGKVGIPLGIFNGFTQTPMPDHVEGFYSEYSNELIVAQMMAINNFINGSGFTGQATGPGLNAYADYVDAKKDDTKLSEAINTQIEIIIQQTNGLNETLSNAVIDEPEACKTLYQSMQKLVPLFKVDLTSALGVLITYQDNDGD